MTVTDAGGQSDSASTDAAVSGVGVINGTLQIVGTSGRDRVQIMLAGDEGNDTLLGDNGSDILLGGADNDTLQGGLGRNLLIGGSGRDLLLGGGGGRDSDWRHDSLRR